MRSVCCWFHCQTMSVLWVNRQCGCFLCMRRRSLQQDVELVCINKLACWIVVTRISETRFCAHLNRRWRPHSSLGIKLMTDASNDYRNTLIMWTARHFHQSICIWNSDEFLFFISVDCISLNGIKFCEDNSRNGYSIQNNFVNIDTTKLKVD